MNCNVRVLKTKSTCNNGEVINDNYEFKDGFCFKNNQPYGKIVYSDNQLITIEVDNGNKYMKGQIIDFKLTQN